MIISKPASLGLVSIKYVSKLLCLNVIWAIFSEKPRSAIRLSG